MRIYALEWEGAVLEGAETIVLPAAGVRSHVRQRRFARLVADHVARHPVDLVVGMNKMPGLDVYYAADSCFEAKARTQRPWPYRLTTRYRHYAEFETRRFRRTRPYPHPHHRPRPGRGVQGPSIARRRTGSIRCHRGSSGTVDAPRLRAGRALRRELGIAADDILLLFVGSGFVKKGLDRTIGGVGRIAARGARTCASGGRWRRQGRAIPAIGAKIGGRFAGAVRRRPGRHGRLLSGSGCLGASRLRRGWRDGDSRSRERRRSRAGDGELRLRVLHRGSQRRDRPRANPSNRGASTPTF